MRPGMDGSKPAPGLARVVCKGKRRPSPAAPAASQPLPWPLPTSTSAGPGQVPVPVPALGPPGQQPGAPGWPLQAQSHHIPGPNSMAQPGPSHAQGHLTGAALTMLGQPAATALSAAGSPTMPWVAGQAAGAPQQLQQLAHVPAAGHMQRAAQYLYPPLGQQSLWAGAGAPGAVPQAGLLNATIARMNQQFTQNAMHRTPSPRPSSSEPSLQAPISPCPELLEVLLAPPALVRVVAEVQRACAATHMGQGAQPHTQQHPLDNLLAGLLVALRSQHGSIVVRMVRSATTPQLPVTPGYTAQPARGPAPHISTTQLYLYGVPEPVSLAQLVELPLPCPQIGDVLCELSCHCLAQQQHQLQQQQQGPPGAAMVCSRQQVLDAIHRASCALHASRLMLEQHACNLSAAPGVPPPPQQPELAQGCWGDLLAHNSQLLVQLVSQYRQAVAQAPSMELQRRVHALPGQADPQRCMMQAAGMWLKHASLLPPGAPGGPGPAAGGGAQSQKGPAENGSKGGAAGSKAHADSSTNTNPPTAAGTRKAGRDDQPSPRGQSRSRSRSQSRSRKRSRSQSKKRADKEGEQRGGSSCRPRDKRARSRSRSRDRDGRKRKGSSKERSSKGKGDKGRSASKKRLASRSRKRSRSRSRSRHRSRNGDSAREPTPPPAVPPPGSPPSSHAAPPANLPPPPAAVPVAAQVDEEDDFWPWGPQPQQAPAQPQQAPAQPQQTPAQAGAGVPQPAGQEQQAAAPPQPTGADAGNLHSHGSAAMALPPPADQQHTHAEAAGGPAAAAAAVGTTHTHGSAAAPEGGVLPGQGSGTGVGAAAGAGVPASAGVIRSIKHTLKQRQDEPLSKEELNAYALQTCRPGDEVGPSLHFLQAKLLTWLQREAPCPLPVAELKLGRHVEVPVVLLDKLGLPSATAAVTLPACKQLFHLRDGMVYLQPGFARAVRERLKAARELDLLLEAQAAAAAAEADEAAAAAAGPVGGGDEAAGPIPGEEVAVAGGQVSLCGAERSLPTAAGAAAGSSAAAPALAAASMTGSSQPGAAAAVGVAAPAHVHGAPAVAPVDAQALSALLTNLSGLQASGALSQVPTGLPPPLPALPPPAAVLELLEAHRLAGQPMPVEMAALLAALQATAAPPAALPAPAPGLAPPALLPPPAASVNIMPHGLLPPTPFAPAPAASVLQLLAQLSATAGAGTVPAVPAASSPARAATPPAPGTAATAASSEAGQESAGWQGSLGSATSADLGSLPPVDVTQYLHVTAVEVKEWSKRPMPHYTAQVLQFLVTKEGFKATNEELDAACPYPAHSSITRELWVRASQDVFTTTEAKEFVATEQGIRHAFRFIAEEKKGASEPAPTLPARPPLQPGRAASNPHQQHGRGRGGHVLRPHTALGPSGDNALVMIMGTSTCLDGPRVRGRWRGLHPGRGEERADCDSHSNKDQQAEADIANREENGVDQGKQVAEPEPAQVAVDMGDGSGWLVQS